MSSNTSIKLRRTENPYSNFEDDSKNGKEPLTFGEPIFIDNGIVGNVCNAYINVGIKSTNTDGTSKYIKDGRVFKGFKDKSTADKLVFNANGSIVDESGNEVSVNKITDESVTLSKTDTDKYYLLTKDKDSHVRTFSIDDNGIYITGNGVLHGAAWNDYAEYRECESVVKPGEVVAEVGNGKLTKTNERLQPCSYVVSDTYGMIIGTEANTTIPVGISGKVLVYVEDDTYTVGDCLCAGVNGVASKMSRQEIINYPDRILGVVVEVPTYDKYNDRDVDGRVWVRLK